MLTFAPQPCPPSEKTAILSPSKMLKLASEKHFISLQRVLPPKPHILSKEELKALVKKHEKCVARQALLYQVLKEKELLDKISDPLLPLLLKLQIEP